MENSNDDFRKELDELVNLFKKLRNKPSFKEIIGDSMELKAIDLLIENYDMIKNNIPDDVLSALSGNIKDMIRQISEDLKEDLQEADMLYPEKQEESKHDLINDINEIDKLLAKGNLSENEINDLLDMRQKLKKD